jgi:hypothetical protein
MGAYAFPFPRLKRGGAAFRPPRDGETFIPVLLDEGCYGVIVRMTESA